MGKEGELQGLPEIWSHENPPSGFDSVGQGVRIASTVTIFRGSESHPKRGIRLGDNVVLFDRVRLVMGDLVVNSQADLIIENNVMVNAGAYLSGEGGLILEKEVLVGPGAKILSAGHEIDGPPVSILGHTLTYGRICIQHGAWIGAGAIVREGVTVGRGAVVGAGSVVTRDVSPGAVVVGNPARFLRWRKGFQSTGLRGQGWWNRLKSLILQAVH
jgi:acetyltransferase-like isoleucine patch superfamily enzyme